MQLTGDGPVHVIGGEPVLTFSGFLKDTPKPTMSLLAITGSGAANCAAQATGGQEVFNAGNAQDFELKRMPRRDRVDLSPGQTGGGAASARPL